MKNKWMWIGLGSIALIGGGVAIWYFTKPNSTSSTATSTTDSKPTLQDGVSAVNKASDMLNSTKQSTGTVVTADAMRNPLLMIKKDSLAGKALIQAGLSKVNEEMRKKGKAEYTQAQWDEWISK